MKYTYIIPVTGLAAAACSCTSVKKEAAQKPLNIVYIMTDDHTAQMMSCYDTRYMETPNLDRIAEEGVLFTNSFVANSLSGPSRACMITGKHSCANKFYSSRSGRLLQSGFHYTEQRHHPEARIYHKSDYR